MSNYLVTDTDLTSVADAIRAKSGGSGQLAFPAGWISEIAGISEIPAYLGHMRLTPEENLRSVDIPIGDAHIVLISSTHDLRARSYTSAVGGIVYVTGSGSIYSTGSRMLTINTSGNISYTASTGSGQNWSASDGVLTISNTSGFVFVAGVTYDFFWF